MSLIPLTAMSFYGIVLTWFGIIALRGADMDEK